jgi:hypothetical protein
MTKDSEVLANKEKTRALSLPLSVPSAGTSEHTTDNVDHCFVTRVERMVHISKFTIKTSQLKSKGGASDLKNQLFVIN